MARIIQSSRISTAYSQPPKQPPPPPTAPPRTTRSTHKKPSTPKPPPSSSLYDTTIYILIGPTHTKYGIHKALLCARSSFFRAALTGRFKEAREGTVTLEDEDPETFSRFNTWLYTGSCMNDDAGKVLAMRPALQLWLFAEKRLVPGLQNTVIDQLIQSVTALDVEEGRVRHEISAEDEEACISAWENSIEDSRLRTFLLDHFLIYLDLETIFKQERAAKYPLALITAIVIRAQKAGMDFSDDFFGDLRYGHCKRYHVHELKDPVCKTLKGAEEDDTDEGDEEEDAGPRGMKSVGGSTRPRR